MFLLKLSFRNVLRNKRRSLLTMITIFFAIFGFVMASGMVTGIEQSFINNDIRTESGHLRVMGKGYLKEEEDLPLKIVVDQAAKVEQVIKAKWKTARIAPRLIFSAQLSDGTHSLTVRGIAINTKRAESVYALSKNTLKRNKLPQDKNVIFLGQRLAQTFKKKVGDSLTVLVRTRAGSLNALDFKIQDIVAMGNSMVDGFSFFVPMKAGRKLLQMPSGLTDLVVKLSAKYASVEAARIVAKVSAKNNPQTWQQKAEAIIELNKMRRKIFQFMLAVILLVGAAGMANTLLMSGFERRGEIGMMLAMGMQRSGIVKLFALEAGLLGFVSSLLGIICGGVWVLYLQIYGWDISSQMKLMESGGAGTIAYTSMIYFELLPSVLVMGLFVGVLVSVLASVWPAQRITRMEPREILAGG